MISEYSPIVKKDMPMKVNLVKLQCHQIAESILNECSLSCLFLFVLFLSTLLDGQDNVIYIDNLSQKSNQKQYSQRRCHKM